MAPKSADPLHRGHVCGQPLLSLTVPSRLVARGALPMRSVHVPPRAGRYHGQEQLPTHHPLERTLEHRGNGPAAHLDVEEAQTITDALLIRWKPLHHQRQGLF